MRGSREKEYRTNIENRTEQNKKFRQILHTTKQQQLVLMNVPSGDEIGLEKHKATQFFRVESGRGIAHIIRPDGTEKRYSLKSGYSLTVPEGFYHNIINTSHKRGLKLYTIYSPPVHH